MGDFDGERKDLPNATAALVLGALSLVFCWCYGIIGLVLGILAVVLASAPRKAYLENPERFTEVSYKNLNAGRICGTSGFVSVRSSCWPLSLWLFLLYILR